MQYDLNKYRAILFDVDGVLRRGSQLIPDVAETLSKLREQEVAIGVVTNNSGSGAQAIAQYLAKLGVFFQPHEVISQSMRLQCGLPSTAREDRLRAGITTGAT